MISSGADVFCITDKGLKRPNNEDQAGVLNQLGFQVLLVADGMGGHSSGEVASKIAKDTIISLMSLQDHEISLNKGKKLLHHVAKKANSEIHRLSSKDVKYYGMGTTLVLALVLNDQTIVLNCGDSRAYTYRKIEDKLTLITKDQTVVQYLYNVGAITKDEMKESPKKHVLMNALGIGPNIDYDISIIDNDYDILLLCSDGLSNMIDDEEIKAIISLNNCSSAETISKALLNKAMAHGGLDNIAVCIMEVKR